jgi:hypothetical protein
LIGIALDDVRIVAQLVPVAVSVLADGVGHGRLGDRSTALSSAGR